MQFNSKQAQICAESCKDWYMLEPKIEELSVFDGCRCIGSCKKKKKTETLQPPSGSPPLNIDWGGNLLKQNKMLLTLVNSTIVVITEWDVTGPNGLIHIVFGDEADCKIIYRDGGWNFQISR